MSHPLGCSHALDLQTTEVTLEPVQNGAELRQQYLRCYPWGQGHRWGLGVQRGLGHQGSQEHQQYQERPVGGRTR